MEWLNYHHLLYFWAVAKEGSIVKASEKLRQLGPVNLICREDKPDRLLAELAIHGLDFVLTDSPIDPLIRVKAFSHLLGECGVTFFASGDPGFLVGT